MDAGLKISIFIPSLEIGTKTNIVFGLFRMKIVQSLGCRVKKNFVYTSYFLKVMADVALKLCISSTRKGRCSVLNFDFLICYIIREVYKIRRNLNFSL